MSRHLSIRTGGISKFVSMIIQSKVVIGENMHCCFGVKVPLDPTQQEFYTVLDAVNVDFIPEVSIKRLLHFAFIGIVKGLHIGEAITSNINDATKAIAD